MNTVVREDLLLAVRRVQSRTGHLPAPPELADLLRISPADLTLLLQELQEAGEIASSGDGTYLLTPSGEAAAAAVMKKHKVLETFFEEMLGMDRDAAHQQACTLEHHASEETISRLDEFIGAPPRCMIGRHRFHRRDRDGSLYRLLAECGEGDRICIAAIRGCGRSSRLADLGLIPGQEVIVRRKMAQTMLVQVKGTDIAISADIANTVLVENCE